MKHLVLTTIAAVVLMGCGEPQQSAPSPEVKPAEPVAEATKPEPPTAKAPDISIHEAAEKGNIKIVNQHLAAGTDVNLENDAYGGSTPLHVAAYYGRKEIAELLIDEGADVNVKIDEGWTPIHEAANGGNKEITGFLISEGADVNAIDAAGQTPLDVAILTNHTEAADILRKHGGKIASVSAQSSHSPIEAKQDKPIIEESQSEPPTGKTPDISIHKAVLVEKIEAVKQHLAAGTDVDARDGSGRTSLHIAADFGRKKIAELLIAKGADVNAKDEYGDTPLDNVSLLYGVALYYTETVDLLRKHGGKTGEELKAAGN